MKKFFTILFLLVCCPLSQITAEQLKLGAIIGLSGDMAAWGDRCQKAYALAEEDYKRKKTALAVQLIVEDSPNTLPKNTLTALQKLDTMDNVLALLGVFSPEEVDAIAPVLQRKGIGLVSFVPGTHSPKDALFLWPDPQYEASQAAVALRKKYSKIGILGDTTAWTEKITRKFIEEFQRLDGVIVSAQSLPTESKSVRSEVLRVKQAAPEAIFIPSYYLFSLYTKELHALKVELPRYGLELDESARTLSAPYGAGVRFLRPSSARSLDARFKERFGVTADLPASYCYDQLALTYRLLESLRPEEQNRAGIAKALSEIKEYSGESGSMNFKDTGTESPLSWFEFGAHDIKEVQGP